MNIILNLSGIIDMNKVNSIINNNTCIIGKILTPTSLKITEFDSRATTTFLLAQKISRDLADLNIIAYGDGSSKKIERRDVHIISNNVFYVEKPNKKTMIVHYDKKYKIAFSGTRAHAALVIWQLFMYKLLKPIGDKLAMLIIEYL